MFDDILKEFDWDIEDKNGNVNKVDEWDTGGDEDVWRSTEHDDTWVV